MLAMGKPFFGNLKQSIELWQGILCLGFALTIFMPKQQKRSIGSVGELKAGLIRVKPPVYRIPASSFYLSNLNCRLFKNKRFTASCVF